MAKPKEKPVKNQVKVDPPKPVVIDYYIDSQVGELDKTRDITRIVVKDRGVIVNNIDGLRVSNGYGVTYQDAVKDFIMRNTSDVLDKIFNVR